ncbi:S-layer homology domain-containing protein [Caryophanon latum]|uniref:SLH domain-containing protein n=1 Tax=Caryophanon latum TaxID=33977 RepID=A0A1C0YAX7_9BACL|nr:S-layer homology domain-containing protein [Caryophanon latum]OCS84347.1 hypothetical protein A6K76_15690 [Caryophanon latum]
MKLNKGIMYAALATLCIGQASSVEASAQEPNTSGDQKVVTEAATVNGMTVDYTEQPIIINHAERPAVEIMSPLVGQVQNADGQAPQHITTNATYMDVLTNNDAVHTYIFTVTGKTKVTWQYKHVEQALWQHTLYDGNNEIIGSKEINSASHGLFTTYEKILSPGTYYMTITGNEVAMDEHYTFTLTEVLPKTFDDVPAEHPYHDEIGAIQQMGIITGFENNTFEPEAFIQRKHIAAMIMRAEADVQLVSSPPNFADVPFGHLYYQDIMGLYRSDIVAGKIIDGAVYFEPDAHITRAQLAKILVKAFNIEAVDEASYYTDIPEDHWHFEAANILASHGILFDNTATFNGDAFVTRADFAHVLYRAMHIVK